MSHGITIREDGFAEAAYSLEPAWHGLGTVFDHAMSSREALEGAGLDWGVEQESVYQLTSDGVSRVYAELPKFKLNFRADTDAVLGMVTDQYKVVQNVEAFEFLDELVENHEMLYESAFSLYGGRRVCVLARMPGVREVVEGDPLLPYVLLSLSHDGTGAIKFGPTAVRVVCANTYTFSLSEGNVKDLSIRHTGNIKGKLRQARNILGIASEQFNQYAEVGKTLAQRQLSNEEWREYLDIMCPELDPRDPDYTGQRENALAKTRLSIKSCFRNDRQATAPGTAWAAYNAVAEHMDHLPRRGATQRSRSEARFNVTMFGAGRDIKRRAFETACRFADVQPVP